MNKADKITKKFLKQKEKLYRKYLKKLKKVKND